MHTGIKQRVFHFQHTHTAQRDIVDISEFRAALLRGHVLLRFIYIHVTYYVSNVISVHINIYIYMYIYINICTYIKIYRYIYIYV